LMQRKGHAVLKIEFSELRDNIPIHISPQKHMDH
jgi:hypothetical protein